jgi:hypothetical protein
MRTALWAAALTVLLAPAARADTYGLLPWTEFEREWRADETGLDAPRLIVIRSAAEWAALWRQHAPREKVPAVDFDRWMVVGVMTPAGARGRVVYRVELDDAARPAELVVRVAAEGGLSQRPTRRDIKGARLHLAQTSVSALPVRFVQDGMVDGAVFAASGPGVDEKPLGKVAGLKAPAGKGAAYREQAEQLVRAALTAEDLRTLRQRVWPQLLGERYPQPWSVVRVRPAGQGWSVEYDGLRFEVSAATGRVTRVGGR